MKGMITIIQVSKKEGQALNKVAPDLVTSTVHKRHYYVVDCKKTWKLLESLGYVYLEKLKG